MRATFTPISLLLLFLVLSDQVTAQKKEVPGYIVTLQSDTIQGVINDQNWNKNPTSIQFKKEGDATFTAYKPWQIQAFYIESGEHYESAKLAVDQSPSTLNELLKNAAPLIVQDTVFLTVYVKGTNSLYYLKDEFGKVHFFIRKDTLPIQELILRRSIVRDDKGGTYIKEISAYIGTLTHYMADCPALKKKIEKAKYTQQSLQPLFVAYNSCSGASAVKFEAVKEKVQVHVGVLAGVATTRLDIYSASAYYLSDAVFSRSTDYTAGVSFDITIPRDHRKWSIYNEVRWHTYELKGVYQQFRSNDYYTYNSITLGVGSVGLVNMIRYRFWSGRIKPFVNVGVANTIALIATNKNVVETRLYSSFSIKEREALESMRKYEQKLLVGLGASLNRLTAECRYELGNGMSSAGTIRSTTRTFLLQLGYRFN